MTIAYQQPLFGDLVDERLHTKLLAVFAAYHPAPVLLGTLAVRTGASRVDVARVLTQMELTGQVRRLSGDLYKAE